MTCISHHLPFVVLYYSTDYYPYYKQHVTDCLAYFLFEDRKILIFKVWLSSDLLIYLTFNDIHSINMLD